MISLSPVVKNLIIICVVIFLIQKIVPQLNITGMLALWKIGTNNFQPYQLFTYMFVHGSVGHIFFNMLTFAFMGPQLEVVWGFRRFLMYFLITGIGASVIYVLVEFLLDPGGIGIMLGASGAIYGMLMAYAFLYPETEVRLMFPPIAIKGKYLAIVLGVFNYMMDDSGQVAHLAHLGGALVGFVTLRLGLLKD